MTISERQQGISHSAEQPIIGVLLVHGMNGSRQDFAEMERSLRACGMVAHNMLLPGHGTHVCDLIPLGWADWERAVREELAALKQRCELVFLVGHSLGGALALHTAAHEDVAGVVSMCAPLYMHWWTACAVNLIKRVTPVLPTVREDIRDPKARRRHRRDVYRWTPLSPVESLLQFLPRLRAELPRITAPVLVMASAHDHVVPASDGREIFRRLGSDEKDLVVFHRSYHVIMKDYDRREVFYRTLRFIRYHASKSTIRVQRDNFG